MEDKNITGLENISSELEAQLEIYLKNFALLYADNTVLMLLNNFYEYSKLWKLIKVNIDKTKIMVFSTSRTAENVHFLYNEKEIETVTEFNYLGHSQKSWVILLMNIHKPNRVMYDVSK